MVINKDIITLTKKEVKELIDRECKKRLGISYEQFLQDRKEGKLLPSTAVHDIETLLKLA